MKKLITLVMLSILAIQTCNAATAGHDMLRRYGINSHSMQTAQYFKSPKKSTKNKDGKKVNTKKNHTNNRSFTPVNT